MQIPNSTTLSKIYTVQSLQLTQDNISSLFSDHVSRDGSEGTGDTRVNRGINNTKTRDTTDLELGVEDGHRVVISTDRAGARGVVTPSTVLDIVLDVFLGGDILAGEDLGDIDGLTVKCVTGQLDGLVESLEVSFVVTDAGVEVVEGDVGDVERVGRAESDGTSVVTRVSLQDSPSKPVVVNSGVNAVVREVATEVDGATEGEDIEAVIGGNTALVEHGSSETRRRVDTAVAEDGGLPAVDAGVVAVIDVESAAIETAEVLGRAGLDGDFVVVLQVGTDTGQVGDDGDVELLQFLGGTDTTQLEQLRRVVDTTSDDDFTRCLDRSGGAGRRGLGGSGASLVEVLAVQELDTSSTRGVLRLVEGDLGDMAVHADIKRVLLAAILVGGIANSDDEFTGAIAVGVVSRDRDLVVSRLGVASLSVRVGIATQQSADVHDVVRKVAQSKGSTGEHAQQLGVLQDDTERGGFGREPAIVAMALGGAKQIVVILQASEVPTHVLRRPGAVIGQRGNVFEVGLVGVDGNQGVVGGASSQGTGARVQCSLHLRSLWRAETGIF